MTDSMSRSITPFDTWMAGNAALPRTRFLAHVDQGERFALVFGLNNFVHSAFKDPRTGLVHSG